MIPQIDSFLADGLEIQELPSFSYNLDVKKNRISGNVDNIQAVVQTVFLMLNIERFDWEIFSSNYGCEFTALIGKNIDYAIAEIERITRETLMIDTRIEAVKDFAFDIDKNKVYVRFTLKTIYGDTDIETEVAI